MKTSATNREKDPRNTEKRSYSLVRWTTLHHLEDCTKRLGRETVALKARVAAFEKLAMAGSIQMSGVASSRASKVETLKSIKADFQQSTPLRAEKIKAEPTKQNPNCVGSSVAAMGEEPEEDLSDWISWGTQVVRHSETFLPGSIPEPVEENNGENYDENDDEIDGENDDDYDLNEVGNAFPQNAYLVTQGAQRGGNHDWTTSEAQLAQVLGAHPLRSPAYSS